MPKFHMIRVITAFFLTLCSVSIGYGQSKNAVIEDIKTQFKNINENKDLRILKLENDEIDGTVTDGGVELKAYFKGDDLCKIYLWVGLSFGVRQYEYYLKNNQLFFVYEKEEDFPYDQTKGSLNSTKLIPAFEGRYYLNDNRIIDIKSKGKKRVEKNSISSFKTLRTDVDHYIKIIRKHLKKRENSKE